MNRKYFTPKHLEGLMSDLMLRTSEREAEEAVRDGDFERELELDMKREWERDE